MGDEDAVQNITTNIYGDVCLRKARRKRQKRLITELLFDYTRNTTLHGLPYITKKGLTVPEKIFWIITSIISISWCSVLIYQLWFRWKTSPVIVTISEEVVSVREVPFPSVTICPQLKCRASVYNFTDELYQINKLKNESNPYQYAPNSSLSQRINKWKDINTICKFLHIEGGRKFTNSSMIKNIVEVSPNTVFSLCQLSRKMDKGCINTFSTVLTREGVCFTANSLAYNEIFREEKVQDTYKYLDETRPSKGWNIEDGYNNSEPDPYPRRGIENGLTPDLVVVMFDNKNERDDLCNAISTGFKVYIHHPSDMPQSSLYYYAVINKQVSSIALSFNILNTTESLRPYAPEIRQCYFPDERYLKYFRHYTAKNCWTECISNYTFKKCGCVDFYMPHDNSGQICAEGSSQCIIHAQDELVREESESSNGCHCLPACVSVDYDAEILKMDFNIEQQLKNSDNVYNRNYTSQLQGIEFSKLEMYYKRRSYLSMRRSELFATTEFIANCGGLLGLFIGFSFLTLVEFLYYFTLRLWCTLKKDLKDEKKQALAEK